MNTRIYLITIVTTIGIIIPVITYGDTTKQIQKLMQPDSPNHTKNTQVTDSNKLLKELENYESYRPDGYRDLASYPYSKDTEVTDSNKLLKELENYESYRPDTYSDATRNPFGDKRYKNLKAKAEGQN